MWESPINMIYGEMQTQIENDVYKVVQNVGIDVSKEELLKALMHDRNQYDKGYKDGYEEGLNADKWIPCSERYPEVYHNVIVCTKDGGRTVAHIPFNFTNRFQDMHCTVIDDVVAWQELPRPYKNTYEEEE